MKHKLSITFFLIISFIAAQVIGLAIVNSYIDTTKTQQTGKVTFEELPLGIERPHVEEDYSFAYIVSAVIIGTILLFLLIRFNAKLLWKLWYFSAIFITMTVAAGAFMSQNVSAIIGLIVAFFRVIKPNIIINNFSELFIYGGISAIFVPIMNIPAAIIMLILISVYDMYAVWKSKHMIKLANFQRENNMFAGLNIPYKKGKPAGKKYAGEKIQTAVLGGGDIAFPLIFAGVVMKEFGFIYSLAIPLFAAVALTLLLIKGKEKTFYPAMPFISAGCIVGYLVVLWI